MTLSPLLILDGSEGRYRRGLDFTGPALREFNAPFPAVAVARASWWRRLVLLVAGGLSRVRGVSQATDALVGGRVA